MPDRDEWVMEQEDALRRFAHELAKVTSDGAGKRRSGVKPPWYRPQGEAGSHEAAVFSHITKWKRGLRVDPESGAHPLVHAAWRLLAIACTESGNKPRAELWDALDPMSRDPALD